MNLAEQVQRLVRREKALEAELLAVRRQLASIRRFMGEAAAPKAPPAKKLVKRTGLADRVRQAVQREPWLRADQLTDRIGQVPSHKLHNALTTLVQAGSIVRSPDRPYRFAMPDQKETLVLSEVLVPQGSKPGLRIKPGRYLQCSQHALGQSKGCKRCSGTGWVLYEEPEPNPYNESLVLDAPSQ